MSNFFSRMLKNQGFWPVNFLRIILKKFHHFE